MVLFFSCVSESSPPLPTPLNPSPPLSTPPHPSQPLPTAPYLSPRLSSSLPCLFQTLIINEVNQGACHFLHLIIKKFITFSSSTDLRKNTMQLLKIVIAEEEKSNKQKQKTKTHTHTKKKKTKHTKEQPSNYEFESLTKAIIWITILITSNRYLFVYNLFCLYFVINLVLVDIRYMFFLYLQPKVLNLIA